MLNIVLFGPPGSGKGTQSIQLADRFGLKHISTGDIFREELANNTVLGQQAREYMDKGMLVPDSVVIKMLSGKLDEYLKEHPKGFIFDGFPRTIAQAESLDRMLEEKGLSISGVLALEVEDEELVKRILNRGKTSGRSDDTDVATIQKRIDVYKAETAPVAGFYEMGQKLRKIIGVGSIDSIFERMVEVVESFR
jgi:adenylate kinase